MIVLYPECSKWEISYIKNDLLNEEQILSISDKIKTINYYFYNNIPLVSDIEEHIKKDEDKNIVLVFSTTPLITNIEISIMVNFIKYLKPQIIISLSDEFGDHNYLEEISNYTKLYLHSYNHNYYSKSKNTYQIPLGYVTKYIGNNSFINIKNNILKIDKRINNCSFIGQVKSDRQQMIDIFNNNMSNCNIINTKNSWNIDQQLVTPESLFNIYNNSIFVLIGRGYYSLDCFRIYEAIIAGAIPLIVGEENEINSTFNFNNNKPYLLHDKTWEQLLQKCLILLNNTEELQYIQDYNINWYINKIKNINKLIENALLNKL